MEKQKVVVPKGIRYISEWKGFNIPDFPCIFNKQLTGCGFTEYCITNDENLILCSPRKILLENKEEQHPEVLYVRNEFEKSLNIDKDLTLSTPKGYAEDEDVQDAQSIKDQIDSLKEQIKSYTLSMETKNLPVKILVTYDSFRYVRESLESLFLMPCFRVVVDEWQSIFTDSTFKSSTEIEFLDHLRGLSKLCYVSATPMIDKYLEMMDEFKDLPYYELDWGEEEPGRIIKPNLIVNSCRSITKEAEKVINSYRNESEHVHASFIDESGKIIEIESKEAVIYVNSVRNICDIIKKTGLKLDETNVLCARTPENEKKVRKAFGVSRKVQVLGRVPTRNEPRKMFTLCTRTVYLGADFYSTNARSFIFSDANIDSLTVDITLDLPQILGRQRLDENPWKNAATLYYKVLDDSGKITPEKFQERIEEKERKTENLLLSYKNSPTEASKHDLAAEYQYLAKSKNYKDHYVAVNTHGGTDLVPVFNELVRISNLRTYEIQQVDYKDRFNVFSSLETTAGFSDREVDEAVSDFDSIKTIVDRLKYMCNVALDPNQFERFVCRIPTMYQNYYRVLGIDRIKSLGYNKYYLDKEYSKLFGNQDIDQEVKNLICNRFNIGEKYSKSDIKNILKDLYASVGYNKTAKANDLEEYFELRDCQITNKDTGKRDKGFEIIKKK